MWKFGVKVQMAEKPKERAPSGDAWSEDRASRHTEPGDREARQSPAKGPCRVP